MGDIRNKDIIIRHYDIQTSMEKAEKEANELVSQGYELFSSNICSMHGISLRELVLIFKKKK